MEYPKTIYVKLDGDEGEKYLHASDDPDMLVDTGDSVVVAEYELKQKVELKNETSVNIT
ncbi:MAG: hypothetical protein V3U75_04220 [Methylococcaceae bacterium]